MGKTEFIDWLNQHLTQRGWRPTDLAKAASISPATVTHILNDERNIGTEVGKAIARALDISEIEVFRQAGLLSPEIEHDDPYYEALNRLWEMTPDWKKRDLVVTLRAFIEDHQRREEERERRRRLGEPVDEHEVY